MRWFVFCRLNNWRSFGAEKFHTSPGHFILNFFRLDIILFGLLLSQNVVHVKLRLDFLCVFLTARLAAIVLADGGSASVHKWPVPVRALTLFLKCGLMDKLWRTEFFQRSSLALKYGNLSLHQPKKKEEMTANSHKVIKSRDGHYLYVKSRNKSPLKNPVLCVYFVLLFGDDCFDYGRHSNRLKKKKSTVRSPAIACT